MPVTIRSESRGFNPSRLLFISIDRLLQQPGRPDSATCGWNPKSDSRGPPTPSSSSYDRVESLRRDGLELKNTLPTGARQQLALVPRRVYSIASDMSRDLHVATRSRSRRAFRSLQRVRCASGRSLPRRSTCQQHNRRRSIRDRGGLWRVLSTDGKSMARLRAPLEVPESRAFLGSEHRSSAEYDAQGTDYSAAMGTRFGGDRVTESSLAKDGEADYGNVREFGTERLRPPILAILAGRLGRVASDQRDDRQQSAFVGSTDSPPAARTFEGW